MKFQQTVLVADMDDTLLDDKKRISKRNKDAIREFQNSGGIFTVATGRSIAGFSPYQNDLKIKIPVILYNGGCIYDCEKKQILWVKELDESVKRYIEKLIEVFPLLGIQIMTDKIYSFNLTPICKAYMDRESVDYLEISNIRDVQERWIKVELVYDLVDREKLNTYLQNNLIPGCRCIDTGEYSLEIVKKDVSQGDAILRLQKLMGFKDKKLCCIGDHNNDYEMISIADVSFAVKNGLKKIKEKVNFIVTDNENDAIAETIEKIKQL